jgi:hypothetical protein
MIYERCSGCFAWDTRQNYCRASSGIVSGKAGKPLCETFTGKGFTQLPGGIKVLAPKLKPPLWRFFFWGCSVAA